MTSPEEKAREIINTPGNGFDEYEWDGEKCIAAIAKALREALPPRPTGFRKDAEKYAEEIAIGDKSVGNGIDLAWAFEAGCWFIIGKIYGEEK